MNPIVLVVRGVLAFVLGLVLAIWPGASLTVLLILFPIFAILDGISAMIIGGISSKDGRWLSFIPMGILEIIIGVFVLIWPQATIYAFVLLMALWAFVLGLGELFIAIFDDMLMSVSRWLYAIAGSITFILGILVIAYPLTTSLVLVWLFGIFFLTYGLILLIVGILSIPHHQLAKSK